MKKYCSVVLPVIMMIFMFTGCPGNTEPKIEWFNAEFAMDTNDKRAVVGSVDCTFVGIVERQLRTEQRTIGKTRPDTIPFTIYDVKVLKNIKGELPKDKPITIAQFGGLTKNKKKIILTEGDALLKIGKIYIFNTNAMDDGSYKIGGAFCNVMLEDFVNEAYASETWDPSILDNSELVKEYEEAFKNQLDFPDDLRS